MSRTGLRATGSEARLQIGGYKVKGPIALCVCVVACARACVCALWGGGGAQGCL